MDKKQKLPATSDDRFGYPRPAPKPSGKKKGKKSKELQENG